MSTFQPTFGYNDTERRTVKRHQMSNPLLVRRPMGQVKPTSYDLPSADFTYGQPNQRDPEGASELTTYWQYHRPTPNPRTGRVSTKNTDFSVDNGTRYGTTRADPATTIRFGRPNVPSTPVELVTSAYFQREYLAQREREQAEFTRKNVSRFVAPRPTLASTGHHKVLTEPNRDLWKMQQFRDVPSRVGSAAPRYAAPAVRPTYSYDAGRFPLVRAGMPEGLGLYQYPELPSALPLRPTSRMYGLSGSRSAASFPAYEEQKEASLPSYAAAGEPSAVAVEA